LSPASGRESSAPGTSPGSRSCKRSNDPASAPEDVGGAVAAGEFSLGFADVIYAPGRSPALSGSTLEELGAVHGLPSERIQDMFTALGPEVMLNGSRTPCLHFGRPEPEQKSLQRFGFRSLLLVFLVHGWRSRPVRFAVPVPLH